MEKTRKLRRQCQARTLKFEHPQRRFTNAGEVPKEESLGAKGVPIATTHKLLHQNSPKLLKVANQPPPNLQTSSGARQTDRQMIHNLDVTFPVLSHPQNQPQVPFLDDDGPSSNCRWSIPSSDIFLIPPHCFSLLSSGFFEAKNPSSQALTLT